MTFDIERALLNKPAVTWADIAIRAELTAHHRNDCEPTERVPVWIPGEEPDPKDDWRLCDHSAFAELLRAVMTLGNCVWPIDLSEVYWEQTNRELWERARAKSRVRHAEVVALRKAYARHGA